MSAPVLLFSVPGRRGLGHVMRGLNIAREVRTLNPEASCVFATRGAAARQLVGEEFPVLVVDENDPRTPAQVAAPLVSPDVVVHDTALPDDAPLAPREAYVLRRSTPARQAEVFAAPALRRMDLLIVPHTREDLGDAVPGDLATRCRFVGPVVRSPSRAGAAEARGRYGADGRFLLTSTVGGGGFTEQAEEFFATVSAVSRSLQTRRTDLTHVVLLGPSFTGRLPDLPGAVVRSFDPALVDLLAASDLVLAEGGYNTVSEIRMARVPAVFLPSRRSWDDQEQRVRDLAARGLADVAVGDRPGDRAATVVARALDDEWRAAVRAAYAADDFEPGNRSAAAALLELVQP